MTFALWCVVAAGLMPYFIVGIAKWDSSFDNANPRDWLAAREGMAKRAHAAHLNAFEAFPFFAAAVIVAHLLKAEQESVNFFAGAWLVFRVLYAVFYLANKPTLRSVVWTLAMLCTLTIFGLAARGAGG